MRFPDIKSYIREQSRKLQWKSNEKLLVEMVILLIIHTLGIFMIIHGQPTLFRKNMILACVP